MKKNPSSRFPALAAALLLLSTIAAPLHAEQGKNIIVNPGFERSIRGSEPWSGLSPSGNLEGELSKSDILRPTGGIGPSMMPVSASPADLNNDGLVDIATIDGNGYLRVYFNKGTKENPVFGPGELASVFLKGLPYVDETITSPNQLKHLDATLGSPRLHMADIDRNGRLDAIIGIYSGRLLFLPNQGSATRPDFKNPQRIETADMWKGDSRWGNVLSPFVTDWNNDGKPDLVVGEGSYSANSIHLLLGDSRGTPAFEEKNRHVLAYGMGLEQLSPCVIDWNNDGHPDILSTESSGKVAIFLNDGKPWKPGDTLDFHSFVTIDGAEPAYRTEPPAGDKPDPLEMSKATNLLDVAGVSTIQTADLNGDGLFDLVFGKRTGRIAVALNTGEPGKPKFGKPSDLKADVKPDSVFLPTSWVADVGEGRGNFFAVVSSVKSEPQGDAPATTAPEGNSHLTSYYHQPSTQFMPRATPPRMLSSGDLGNTWMKELFASDLFSIHQELNVPLKVGATYNLTFKAKGSKVSDAKAILMYKGFKQLGEEKVVRGERGSITKQLNRVDELMEKEVKFTVSGDWREIDDAITIDFTKKELNTTEEVTGARLRIEWKLQPGGELALDDFKMVEKQ